MSGILDLLNSSMGKELIGGLSQQMGLNKASTATALGSAIPMLLGALGNNASSSSGASGLLKALGNSNHSGGILDNIGSILGGSSIDDNVMKDGGNILGHVFGGQERYAANAISKSSGIDLGAASGIMKAAAPFVMGYIGKQMLSNNVSDQDGLQSMLGGLLGDDNDSQKDIAARIQGFDNNDDTIDSLAGLVGNAGKQSGGIANLLTGLFN